MRDCIGAYKRWMWDEGSHGGVEEGVAISLFKKGKVFSWLFLKVLYALCGQKKS